MYEFHTGNLNHPAPKFNADLSAACNPRDWPYTYQFLSVSVQLNIMLENASIPSPCFVLDEAALLDTLRCARRHLEPGGLMVFDSWSADDFHANAERWDEELFEDVDELELEGVQYTVAERTRWRRDEQRLDVSYRFTPRRGGEPAMDELPQRYLLSEEIPRLMEDAGLELVVIHGGFDQHVHDEDSEQLIVTAQRPEDDAN